MTTVADVIRMLSELPLDAKICHWHPEDGQLPVTYWQDKDGTYVLDGDWDAHIADAEIEIANRKLAADRKVVA